MTRRSQPGKQGAFGGPLTPETFAPLAAASRGEPVGRVRSLDDARRELRVPNSAEREVLQLWGIPKDFQLVVYPVPDAELPHTVAEFALLRVVKRQGRKLVAGDKQTRLRLGEKGNALWIVYGSLATASDGSLVIESLAIGPAFEDQLGRGGDDIAHGITSQFLRLLRPAEILAACADQLQRQAYWLDETARRRGVASAISPKQREILERIDRGRPQQPPNVDDQLAEIAKRYIVLYQRGNIRPRAQLADEFDISATQVRDRLHQARRHGYLTPGTPGRAGALPGPRLTELGWSPPESDLPTVGTRDNSTQ